MVDVAQLVEPRIVIPVVAGSSPVVHPTYLRKCDPRFLGRAITRRPWLSRITDGFQSRYRSIAIKNE